MSAIHYPDLRASVAAEAIGLLKPGNAVDIHRLEDGSFVLSNARELGALATSESAKALSRFAFDRGAALVRHAYDLRFER